MRTLAAILIAGAAMANIALGTGWFLMGVLTIRGFDNPMGEVDP